MAETATSGYASFSAMRPDDFEKIAEEEAMTDAEPASEPDPGVTRSATSTTAGSTATYASAVPSTKTWLSWAAAAAGYGSNKHWSDTHVGRTSDAEGCPNLFTA